MKHFPPLNEKGATPVELLVFVPVIALLAAFGVFWAGASDRPESFYAARNIAEIRASHPPGQARLLESRYVAELAAETGGCTVTPSAEEWYPQAERLAPSAPPAAPVTVRVDCRNSTSSWVNPAAEQPREPARRVATSPPEPGCAPWGC